MKLKYISEDSLLYLKENSSLIYNKILCGEKRLEDYVEVLDSRISYDAFELVASKEITYDSENVQRVYGHLNMLTLSQAADERIWTAYSLGKCKGYMLNRWKAEPHNKWKARYFFDNSQQRSLYRNGLARLWWIGYAAYDESRDDPYELVKMVCEKQYLIDSILEPNFSSNPVFRRAILNAVFDVQKDGVVVDRDKVIRPLSRYINLQAGTYILDMLSYDELYFKIRKWLETKEG